MRELVYFLPDADGGVAQVIRSLALYGDSVLPRKIVLLSGDGGNNRIQFRFPNAEQFRVDIRAGRSHYAIFRDLVRLLGTESVIVSNGSKYELAAADYFRLPNPVIYLFHGDFRPYYDTVRDYRGCIDRIICGSRCQERKLMAQFPRIPMETVYIPTPAASGEPVPGSGSPLRLLNVTRLEEAKGVRHYPALCAELERRGVDYRLTLVGDGPLRGELLRAFAGNVRVRFAGRLAYPELLEVQRDQDVIVMMSQAEGLPVSLVDAMKARIAPVVFHLDSGIPELVTDGVTGFSVPQEAVGELAERIARLAVDHALLETMKRNAAEHVDRLFDPVRQTAAYERIFLETEAAPEKQRIYTGIWKRAKAHLPIQWEYRVRAIERKLGLCRK